MVVDVSLEGEGPGSGDDGSDGNAGLADRVARKLRSKYLIQ
jgi:hypothetical protein